MTKNIEGRSYQQDFTCFNENSTIPSTSSSEESGENRDIDLKAFNMTKPCLEDRAIQTSQTRSSSEATTSSQVATQDQPSYFQNMKDRLAGLWTVMIVNTIMVDHDMFFGGGKWLQRYEPSYVCFFSMLRHNQEQFPIRICLG